MLIKLVPLPTFKYGWMDIRVVIMIKLVSLPTFELCRPNVWLAPHPPRFSASSVRRRLPCRNIHQAMLHQDWDSFATYIVVPLKCNGNVVIVIQISI